MFASRTLDDCKRLHVAVEPRGERIDVAREVSERDRSLDPPPTWSVDHRDRARARLAVQDSHVIGGNL